MRFPTTIRGIPCQCQVLEYHPYLPMQITGSGYGDAEPPEEEVFNFELLDRKGYRARWLDRYLNPATELRLLKEYLQLRQRELLSRAAVSQALEDIPY